MKTPFLLLALLVGMLAAASVVEQAAGSAAAQAWGYTAPWTLMLWGLVALSVAVTLWRARRHTAVATRCLHAAMAVIMVGALATHLGAREGLVTLARQGVPTNRYLADGRHVHHLPFSVRALAFGTQRSASGAATDHYTRLEVHHADGRRDTHRVAMNRPSRIGAWRLYQIALSPAVTTLSVRHDPVGTGLTYAGYLLLGLAMVAFLVARRTAWHHHWQALAPRGVAVARRRPMCALLPLLLVVLPIVAAASLPAAESLYHSLRPRLWCGIAITLAGMAAMVVLLGHGMHRPPSRPWRRLMALALALSAAYVLFTLTLRGHLAGHFPMSNAYETQQTMALLCLLAPWALWRRVPLLAPLGMVAGGLALVVAALADGSADVGALPPVLSSPLLAIHVTLVMCAYALLALIVGLAAIGLASRRQAHHLGQVAQVLLVPALFLLAAGIMTGALWADISWGRYWGWDPKEVWALITLLIYALPLHARSLPLFARPRVLHAYLLAAFLAVLMTWAGVSLLMGGLHSYA